MADLHDNYLDWLRDAHAMEKQAETMLKGMAGRLEHYPVLEARIKQHIDETIEQQRLVESVIKRYDSSSSTIKDIAGKAAALGQAMGGIFASDEVVKGGISGYTFENFEIASYTALIAAAEAVGDIEGKRVFQQILEQEKAMAAWLLEHLPETTQQFLVRSKTPHTVAKK
ncbi:ferritin-like domain-containing protein [Sodalis sp. RH21]|uniref:ferritin-like domain-containing protein n=1 Tax=unclassified Sodalis (in: enterobacteria) TaxID=2636512 RepID=UPI0039B3BEC3